METKLKILIADDEPDFTVRLKTTLVARAYQVVIASSRTQAQEMTQAERPDMVIIGTMIPRGDAFLFHRWLKRTSRFSQLPIIVLDAPPEKQLVAGWRRDEGMRCEADDFLAKPIEPTAILPRIDKLLDKVTKRIKVLVADDHAMVRDGIRAILALQRDMQVVGEAVNGRDALEKTIQLSPDVVLLDIVMPVMNGLDAARQIGKECRQARILILTQYDDEENILASSQAGALGFISKTAVSSQLLAGIRSVSQGKQFVQTIAR